MGAGVSVRAFWTGVGCATAGVAAFLVAQLHALPPHEDETLALFVGQQPLGDMLDTVLGERGGAPLHFLLVHVATWISPSLTALRLLSVVFAVASIPWSCIPRISAATRRPTCAGSWPNERVLMIGLSGLLLMSATGANARWMPTARPSIAVTRPIW